MIIQYMFEYLKIRNIQNTSTDSVLDYSKDTVLNLAILMESVGGFLILMECYEAASKVLSSAHQSIENVSTGLCGLWWGGNQGERGG